MLETRKKSRFFSFLYEMYKRFIEVDVTSLSAQLAYYFLLSIFPFFIFAFTLIGYLPISTESTLAFVDKFAPEKVTQLLEANLHMFLNARRGWLLVLALIGTLWSASSAIEAILIALDKAYHVKHERSFWVSRGMALLFTIGMVIAIVITLLLPVFGKTIEIFATTHFIIPPFVILVWNIIRWVFSLVFLILIFGVLYYLGPNTKTTIREVLPGAVLAALGWIAVSVGFSFYVNNFSNYTLTYGSLGGVIILMIWFYFSGMIIIIGGQVNAVLRMFRTIE
ncbi:YihY/virulence factor BrkB family protein [Aneurinibacillus sp. Ricciae_BoGa-3]|uniref:YihY/virulence factor BrkB family protein n=1 Tax=Aneurinibacillus sp. Ricciae_BoGa-3 TaxID=3022697 RepID=UPI002341CD71|nr:YihY/virulence factor BrkB family protein [Aneurinibacillus sp. Ricciae_BoGa-3]WCK54410.1 YihY/virulence factor BrkB family protein [Aneurinibacillus sp. Ricciae_BoGa-3]